MKIAAGQLIAITSGEYSDYCLRDHVRALRDFGTQEEAERFMREGDYLTPPDWDSTGEPDAYDSDTRYLAWLIRERIVEPCLEVVELHIGSYNQLKVA